MFHYLFSLKGNQESIHTEMKEYFQDTDFEHPKGAYSKNKG